MIRHDAYGSSDFPIAGNMSGCTGKEPEPETMEETAVPEEPAQKPAGLNPAILLVVLALLGGGGALAYFKFLQRTIEIQQQMEALRQSKAQIASEDYNPGRLDMEAIEAALCEAVEMHDGLVSEDFIDLFVSQVTPLSDSRFAWCLDFSPQPTVAFLNLAGQRKYTTCSMDSKLHFGPFADEEGHTIPFPGSLRR